VRLSVRYERSPIETESPEQLGYENIACNLAESSITDARLRELKIRIDDEIVLQYGDHRGKRELREMLASEAGGLRADDVLLTVGAAGALYIAATALLERGDPVVWRPTVSPTSRRQDSSAAT
jgi:DNA-binding transcriptional MocR family regulator